MVPDGWAKNTPPEIYDGCYLLPDAIPIWEMFERLSRGRDVGAMGGAHPLKWRDVHEAARGVRCALKREHVELALEQLDGMFLRWVNERSSDIRGSD